MGLLNKLETNGSNLSELNGSTPTVPDFALSKLHFEYSINSDPFIANKPNPSTLDLDGINPLAPNRDGGVVPINNSFSKGTYRNSAPPEGVGRI